MNNTWGSSINQASRMGTQPFGNQNFGFNPSPGSGFTSFSGQPTQPFAANSFTTPSYGTNPFPGHNWGIPQTGFTNPYGNSFQAGGMNTGFQNTNPAGVNPFSQPSFGTGFMQSNPSLTNPSNISNNPQAFAGSSFAPANPCFLAGGFKSTLNQTPGFTEASSPFTLPNPTSAFNQGSFSVAASSFTGGANLPTAQGSIFNTGSSFTGLNKGFTGAFNAQTAGLEYTPTTVREETSNINILHICAMPEIQKKSVEEQRFLEYKQKGGQVAPQGSMSNTSLLMPRKSMPALNASPFSAANFTQQASSFTQIFNSGSNFTGSNKGFTGAFNAKTAKLKYKPTCVREETSNFNILHICAMPEIQKKSVEEQRFLEYKQKGGQVEPQGSMSNKSLLMPETSMPALNASPFSAANLTQQASLLNKPVENKPAGSLFSFQPSQPSLFNPVASTPSLFSTSPAPSIFNTNPAPTLAPANTSLFNPSKTSSFFSGQAQNTGSTLFSGISLASNSLFQPKPDIKINIEEPKQVPLKKEKNDLNFTGLKDLFNLSAIKHSNKHEQELENEISVLKQDLSKYKDLYEREKQKYDSIKTELLNIREQLYKDTQKSEDNIENDLPKLITKNRELYEQTLNQSDTLFENKLQIKELTYQRDQIKSQLKEANDKIDELPEARKHVLILLNFIKDIKTGLKFELDLNADYANSNFYKEELAKLFKNLSLKGKACENFEEAIKKSDYLKL